MKRPVSTYSAQPFREVDGPKPTRPLGASPPSLRATIGARLAPPPAPARHVPPKAAPVAYSSEAPRDMAHAVEMREALKASVTRLADAMREMKRTNPQRQPLVAQLQAANRRLGELSAWIRRERGVLSARFQESAIVRALLDVIDRAEEEGGLALTPEEREAVDRAAEFLLYVEEQHDARKAVAAGRVPSLEFLTHDEGSDDR